MYSARHTIAKHKGMLAGMAAVMLAAGIVVPAMAQRDPRDLGLLTSDGTRFIRPDEEVPVPSDEPAIQRQESEQMP